MRAPVSILNALVLLLISANAAAGYERFKGVSPKKSTAATKPTWAQLRDTSDAAKPLDLSAKNYRNGIRQHDAVTYELGEPEYQILNPNASPEIITEDHPHYLENLKMYGQLPGEQAEKSVAKNNVTIAENSENIEQIKQKASLVKAENPKEIDIPKHIPEVSKISEAAEAKIKNFEFVLVKENVAPSANLSSETNSTTTTTQPPLQAETEPVADHEAFIADSVGAYTDYPQPQHEPAEAAMLNPQYYPQNDRLSGLPAAPQYQRYTHAQGSGYTPPYLRRQAAPASAYAAQMPPAQYLESYQHQEFLPYGAAPLTQYSSVAHPSNPSGTPFVYYHFDSNKNNNKVEDLPHLRDFEQLYQSAVRVQQQSTPHAGVQFQQQI